MKKHWLVSIVAVLSLLSSSVVFAEGKLLPKGTVIETPKREKLVLTESRFLIERSDLDHYNALQLRFEALEKAYKDCESQVTQLRSVPVQPAPAPVVGFWDGTFGRTVLVIGGVAVGALVGYGIGKL